MGDKAVVFCAMAEDEPGLRQVGLFVESLRKFGGTSSAAPVRIYLPNALRAIQRTGWDDAVSICSIPEVDAACRPFFLAAKVYCAAHAEMELAARGPRLVWVDDDTLILDEPTACLGESGKPAAFCPVMHNRTGVAWGDPPSQLWLLLDSLFSIDQCAMSPLTTPADEVLIRPYFNAGLMAVDPQCGLMQAWKTAFVALCCHSKVLDLVREKPDDRIFLHQMVLTEVLLQHIGQDQIEVLPSSYNYPLFFNELFSAVRPFDDLSAAITARYDTYFRNPKAGWQNRLKGPAPKTGWLRDRLETLLQAH